jgi:Flp pilus assembly protein TadD
MFSAMAFAHFLAGRFKEAVSWAEMAVLEKPTYLLAVGIAAACYALAGRAGDANKAITRARQLDPTLRLSTIHNLFPLRRPEDIANWEKGLRLAGLPE